MTLDSKLDEFTAVFRSCRLPAVMLILGRWKVRAGHEEHGDALTITPEIETIMEAIDVCGYGALSRLRGGWCWEWWVSCVLAGVIGRLMCRVIVRRGR